jgi:hypothetical protein
MVGDRAHAETLRRAVSSAAAKAAESFAASLDDCGLDLARDKFRTSGYAATRLRVFGGQRGDIVRSIS